MIASAPPTLEGALDDLIEADEHPDDIPPEVEEEIQRDLALLDFRRAAFLRLMRLPPCIDCGRQGTWWDSDPPEVFYCDCPAGERALRKAREDSAHREGMLSRWASRRAEEAARPRRPWVRHPRPGEPGATLQAALRRLQRLGASAGWVDLFAAGWRGPDVLEALRGRPWDGPAYEERVGRQRATPRSPFRPYLIARARWIAGLGAEVALLGTEHPSDRADVDHWGAIANLWLDQAGYR